MCIVLFLKHYIYIFCFNFTSFYCTIAVNLMINTQTPLKQFFSKKRCDIFKKGMCETSRLNNTAAASREWKYLFTLFSLAHLCFVCEWWMMHLYSALLCIAVHPSYAISRSLSHAMDASAILSANCVACQWTTALCIKCRSIWKQLKEIYG